MDTGTLYGVVAFCCAAIDLIINIRSNKAIFNREIQIPFAKLLVFFIAFSICDGLWGFLVSPKIAVNLILLNVFTYIFHAGAALAAYMWLGYMLDYIRISKKTRIFFNILRHIIIIIQFCLIFSNLYTKAFFNISDDYTYLPTKYRNLLFYVQFLYFGSFVFFSIVNTIRAVFGKNNERLKKEILIFLFSVIPLVFGFAQMLFPDGPFYSIGFMITSVLIYGYNVSREQEKFIHEKHKQENNELSSLIKALSADYEAIYYIDVKTNSFKNFVKGSDYDNEINTKIITTGDFFKVLPENINSVVYEQDRKDVLNFLNKQTLLESLQKNNVVSMSYRLINKGVPVYYQMKCIKSQISPEEEKLIVGIFNINSEMVQQNEMNRSLLEAKEKAESANNAKSAFLFNMSHDIRTPMNAIQGFTELIEKNIDDREKVLSYIEKIKLSNGHLLNLINNVLDMARIENNKIVITENPVDVEKMLQNLLAILQVDAVLKGVILTGESVKIKNRYVYADLLHLNQIIINIVNNAIKYTPQGGNVRVIVREIESHRQNYVHEKIIVTDTGIGMKREFLAHIFEEFQRERTTTLSKVEGTGLGMSIVKKLVDLMEGKISISSEEGKGTCVELNLFFKICSEETFNTVNKQEEALPDYEVSLEGKRILVVDDVEFNREITSDVLTDEKMIVETADDGDVAFRKLTEHSADYYDAVLMDIQMPTMNGYDTTREIRALGGGYAELPIIAMTANAFEEDRANAFAAGMNEHIAKPVTKENLKNCLKKILSSRS